MKKPLTILTAVLILVLFTGSTIAYASSSVKTNQAYIGRTSGFINRPSGAGFFILVGMTYTGPLKVLYISGNPYDRGYEYGFLAGEEIYGLLTWAYVVLSHAQGIPTSTWRQRLLGAAGLYEKYIPQEYIDEMKGMADGFNYFQAKYPGLSLGYNITYLDILMINAFVDFSCTGAAISGNLTVDGNAIIGTTIDAEALAPYFIYVVESPEPGDGHRIAYFTAAGSLFQNGFNDVGVGMIEHHIEGWENIVGMPEMIRDRYVLQYADNVSQAIQLFKDIFNKYGFSGYGDDVSLSDMKGNIAKVEVTPYSLGFIVNPHTQPTWPKEDPFLKTGRMLEPVPYIKYYKEGYSSVLRGDGWIVNGLYTVNETVIGIPHHPSTWQEAISNESYSWMWEAPERYMIAHYIYDAQIRGDKLTLKDGVIMSQLPLVGDAPHDDGAIWMEPQLGLAVILKGQSSFTKPIYLQVFFSEKPVILGKVSYDQLMGIAYKLNGSLTYLGTLIQRIQDQIHNQCQQSANIQNELKQLSEQLSQASQEWEKVISQYHNLEADYQALISQGEQVNYNVQEANANIAKVNNTLNQVKSTGSAIIGYQAVIICLLVIILGLLGYVAVAIRPLTS
ncbi:MAG: C45 family autoproteolytic acyltransferase/hydrolase [Desulfurococcales archaeon]|nr:C45 family autoproteolytic acyltransferase/hydrolase [Desulfurococcales archaeon]